MSNQVITIGYLKEFVGNVVNVSASYTDNRYCPTYGELIGGALVTNFKDSTSPLSIVNGIYVNPNFTTSSKYANNQLVIREHLQLKYAELQSIDVSAAKTSVSCCGESTTLSTVGYFKVVTKSEGGTLTTSSTQTSQAVSASYSENETFTSISGNKITFTKNSVNYPTSNSAAERSATVTASYTYSFQGGKTISKSDTVTIKQTANSVGSWVTTSSPTTSISVSPSSMSFTAAGGEQSYTVTRYYTVYQSKYDSCDTVMDNRNYTASTTVTPSTYNTTGAFTCTSSKVSVNAQASGANAREGTLTVKYDGFTDTCSLYQAANSVGDWVVSGDPYGYSYTVSVSPWRDLSCDGGTTYATATLSWSQDYVKTDATGAVISSKTESESRDVTNSTTWSCDKGTISSSGVLSYPASNASGTAYNYVYGTYGSYNDNDYMTQVDCAEAPSDVYVMQKTSSDSSTSIVFPGGVTSISGYGYICCYSTKNGSKQSVTVSSDSSWLTVVENNDLPYDDSNYNFKFSHTENTSTSSRTGKITITQSESNKTVVWSITQEAAESGETKTCIELVYGAQPFCYNETVFSGSLSFDKYEGSNCQSYVESAPTNSITLISNGSGCNLQGGTLSFDSNQTGINFEYKWIGSENTSANSRYIKFIATSSTWNYSGMCTLEQYGTAHTECAPPDLTKNCASVDITGRDWTVTLPYAATSDLVYKFYAVNGHSIDSVKQPDWEQEVSVSKGNKTGTARSTTSQFATDDSYFISVTPSEDDTYNYSDCSITINSDWNGGDDTGTTCTESNNWTSLSVSGSSMAKCDTTSSLTVKASGTHTYANCSTTPTSTTLSSGDYSVTYSPSGKNETSSSRNVTITVTGKGSYSGLTKSTTVTQAAGPCTNTEPICNVPSGTFDGTDGFRIDFTSAVTTAVDVEVKIKDNDCNVVDTIEITVNKGQRTGSIDGNENIGNVTTQASQYFEITNVNPSADTTYIYWGGDCDYDDSNNCTPGSTLTCNPLFLSYDDESHTMTATFEEMAASDVTINFSVKVNNSAIVTDSISISEGNNSNSKTLSTTQAITSTAGTSISISSISPSSDSEYEYNCDTDWEIIPSESQNEQTCNMPNGSFAGSYDFRIDFSEAVASDVTVYIDEKDGECNVVNSFEVTVSKGKKTGYGYDVLDQNHNDGVAAYFEITNISPSEDTTYIYWGGDCYYDGSGNCE